MAGAHRKIAQLQEALDALAARVATLEERLPASPSGAPGPSTDSAASDSRSD